MAKMNDQVPTERLCTSTCGLNDVFLKMYQYLYDPTSEFQE